MDKVDMGLLKSLNQLVSSVAHKDCLVPESFIATKKLKVSHSRAGLH